MKVEEFNEITSVAKKKMMKYLSMNQKATHTVELRKEDFLDYWIAVVAKDYGYNEGLLNGI